MHKSQNNLRQILCSLEIRIAEFWVAHHLSACVLVSDINRAHLSPIQEFL